jgi:hypothetical protein
VYTEACLVFPKKAKSFDGKSFGNICNSIAQAQMKFITRTASRNPAEQANAQLCGLCW